MKQPTQFQFNCKISFVALRDYRSKIDMETWRNDLGWTEENGFVDHWVEEHWGMFKKSPLNWFFDVDEEVQWKFISSVEKRVR